MTSFALLLVLVAAFAHATWNYILKKAAGGTAFIWLFIAASVIVCAPFAAYSAWTSEVQATWYFVVAMLGSAVLQAAYFIVLNRGYAAGDLSLVYPLARGTGPLLSTVVAVVFLGEQPTSLALFGAVLIGVGVFLLLGNPVRFVERNTWPAIIYAFFTGTLIAGYTLWDKYAVSVLQVPPLLMYWGTSVGMALLLAPKAAKQAAEVRALLGSKLGLILGVAVLSSLAYVLVLTAMVFTPVSYVAPAREVSILIGAVMGARFLAEGNPGLRITAALVIVLGVTGLALG